MNAAEPMLAAARPELRRWLSHYRLGLRGLSLFLIALGLAPLAGLTPVEPAHTLSLLGCQLFGLSLTLGNALGEGGLRGFLKAQALGLLMFVAIRALYLGVGEHQPGLALWIEIVLPGGIAASFLFLRSRL